jgi:hypothetical protein
MSVGQPYYGTGTVLETFSILYFLGDFGKFETGYADTHISKK